MITKCPHCKTKFKARDDLKGKKTKCPKCKQPFTINECVVKATPPIQTTQDLRDRVEVCANCRRGISKRDKAYSIDGKIFHAECDKKLRMVTVATDMDSNRSDRDAQTKPAPSKAKTASIWTGIIVSALVFGIAFRFVVSGYAPLSSFRYKIRNVNVSISDRTLRSISFSVHHIGKWNSSEGEYVLIYAVNSRCDMPRVVKEVLYLASESYPGIESDFDTLNGQALDDINQSQLKENFGMRVRLADRRYQYYVGEYGAGSLSYRYIGSGSLYRPDVSIHGIMPVERGSQKLLEFKIHTQEFNISWPLTLKAQVWSRYGYNWTPASDAFETTKLSE